MVFSLISSIRKRGGQGRLLGGGWPVVGVYLASRIEDAEAFEVRKLDIDMQVASVSLPWQCSQTLMLEQFPAP